MNASFFKHVTVSTMIISFLSSACLPFDAFGEIPQTGPQGETYDVERGPGDTYTITTTYSDGGTCTTTWSPGESFTDAVSSCDRSDDGDDSGEDVLKAVGIGVGVVLIVYIGYRLFRSDEDAQAKASDSTLSVCRLSETMTLDFDINNTGGDISKVDDLAPSLKLSCRF